MLAGLLAHGATLDYSGVSEAAQIEVWTLFRIIDSDQSGLIDLEVQMQCSFTLAIRVHRSIWSNLSVTSGT